MKKRLLAMVMSVVMVVGILGVAPPIKVEAANFTARTSAPTTSNQYYYSLNPFYQSGYGMPNCTAYAFGRAYELLGSRPKLSIGNAGAWWNYNIRNGYYSYGSTPRLGAIACWDNYDSDQGHVAVVENISGNSITISESHWRSTNFDTRVIKADSSDYLKSKRFLGYIYIGNFSKGYNPQGSVDLVAAGVNSIWVNGWAFDMDSPESTVLVDVYIGGPAGSGALCHTIRADKERTDVGKVYPKAGNYHGFRETITTNKRGKQKVYLYAIDVGSKLGNSYMGYKEVEIKEIQEKYSVEDVSIVNEQGETCNHLCIGKTNQSVKLRAEVQPANADNKKVIWKSSDASIASVDSNGTVTAKKIGTTTVTATTAEGNYSDTCLIKVTDGNIVYGDFDYNGRITATDLSAMNQVINGNMVVSEAERILYDLNGDSQITKADLDLLNQFLMGVIDTFPVETMLSKIEIAKRPNKLSYYKGDKISTNGLEIIAIYGNGSKKNLTDYLVSGDASKVGNQPITITYEESGRKRTTSYFVQVKDVTLCGLRIIKQPDKVNYVEGEKFNSKGMVFQATYTNGIKKNVTNVNVDTVNGLTMADRTVRVSYQEQGIKQSVDQPVSVVSRCTGYGHFWESYKSNGNGTHIRTCKVCKRTEQKNCALSEGVVEATCMNGGYKEHYCGICGYFYTDGETDKTKHKYDEGVLIKEADCTHAGEIKYICKNCGNEKIKTVKPTGHRNTAIRNAKEATCAEIGYTGETYCTDCNIRIAVGRAIPRTKQHSWNSGVVIKEATAIEEGIKTYQCTVCGREKTETIAVTGTHENGEIFCVDQFTFKVMQKADKNGKNGKVELSKCKSNASVITVPATIKVDGITYEVAAISKKAFQGNKKMKKVVIGKNVTSIGKEAFKGCSKLENVIIKSTKLETIEKDALKGVKSKIKIKVPAKKIKVYKKLLKGQGLGAESKVTK